MRVLGIETSCDETAVAIVDDQKQILAHRLRTQLAEHETYGGVVPEIAARRHLEILPCLVEDTLKDCDLQLNDLDGIAATAGPGLIGGVIVGVMMAKALASSTKLPFLAVNHLVGHALTVRLTDTVPFPFLLLLVSGGHCQLVVVKDVDDYEILGSTLDDAVGESFDKVAKMLGLPYPGGPQIEKMAALSQNPLEDVKRFSLPKPLIHHKDAPFSFSFSGLKTAVLRKVDRSDDSNRIGLCSAFQQTVMDILETRCRNAMETCQEKFPEIRSFVLAGGVAANQKIRAKLENLASEFQLRFVAPPLPLCTDNGVMIAWAGIEKLKRGLIDPLNFAPRPRWPLNEVRKNDNN